MVNREYRKYLSKRLLPGTLVVAIIISLVFPTVYYLLRSRSLESTALNHAQAFTEKMMVFIGNNPTLWRYQTPKILQYLYESQFYQDIEGIHIHNLNGEDVLKPVFKRSERDLDKLPFYYLINVETPLIYNNQKIGSVLVYLSRLPVIKATFIAFLLSLTTGCALSFYIYRLSVRVAGDADEELCALLASLEDQVVERTSELSDALESLATENEAQLQAVEELLESEEKFKAIFDASGDGILLIDSESGRFITGNAMFYRMLGYSDKELSSLGVQDIHPEEAMPYVMEQFVKLQNTGRLSLSMDIPVKRKNGTLFYADIHGILITIAGRQCAVGVFRDTTERMLMEKALQQSEIKFRTMYESATDAIMLLGENGFEDCNVATLRMFGISKKEEFIKFHPAQLSPPYQSDGVDSLTEANDRIAEAFQKGSNSFEWVHRRANGDDFFADVLLTAFNMDGKQVLQASVRDVSARKLMESVLQMSELKLRVITSIAYDAIIMLDEEGNVTFWNGSAEKMFGYAEEEIVGRNLHLMLAPPVFREAHGQAFPHFKQTGQGLGVNRIVEFAGLRKDGGKFPLELSLSVVQVNGAWHSIGIIRDITERKKADNENMDLKELLEQRVIARTSQLEAVNKELESFAYVVSHDLKAPLRAITSLSNWLAIDCKDKLDEEGQETLDLIVQRSKRMDGLINGILNYSHVGRNSEELKLVELEKIVNDAITLVSPPEDVEVMIETKLPTIVCEETMIYQVFQNLISNAVKFMDKPKGDIRVGCVDDGQLYTFYVSDNGQGIEEEYFDKIFQMFQTLKSRDEFESAGVGLTIVKKIVERFGGAVWLESRIGEGSTFRFTLPYTTCGETETLGGGGTRMCAKLSKNARNYTV